MNGFFVIGATCGVIAVVPLVFMIFGMVEWNKSGFKGLFIVSTFWFHVSLIMSLVSFVLGGFSH